MMKHIIAILTVITAIPLGAQSLVADIDFDDCTAMDLTGINPAGIINGSPVCNCGIEGEAILFDGVDDYVEFDNSYTDYFQNNFTLSFYFMLDNSNNIVDILSLQRGDCSKDSSMTIKYIPITNEIQVEYSQSFGQSVRLTSTLKESICWNHISFTKNVSDYSLFINGLKVDEQSISYTINMHPDAELKIANGPCLVTGEERFKGYIDQLQIYSIPLDENAIFNLFSPNDQLISIDTTLYIGDGIQIKSYPTCAQNIQWSPSTGVSNVSDTEPFITPNTTGFYEIEYNHGFCQALDSIYIVLVDPSELDCNNLLLPNAFTPNNDGRNDIYGISNAFIIEAFISFEIFDRWGGKVFNATNKDDKWDGFAGGKSVNPGIMMYRVKYTCGGEEFLKIGSFSIIR